MKITDHKVLIEFSPAKVQFFRIDPEDISATLSDILRTLMDLSWLSKFDQDFEQKAFASRAKKTIDDKSLTNALMTVSAKTPASMWYLN